ncbi:MAG: dipeptide/oligopeptide/nickel ABC transporter ATP-binding protein [Verrucomicrobiales bacterium]|nr:dipeptide/oligopeptide/nickel ABC transporter ATP-binding protein [Verrucomicrobiales bacterium]|tara:strand:+ start:480 stop:1472 length:993 start_codon:yes stop_codon:yes gene_type:complete
MSLLEVSDLRTAFHTREGTVRAVNGVSFSIEKGQTLGIVGESGSGKSVTCYSMLDLIPKPPGKIEQGEALFDGQDLLKLSRRELNEVRGKRISMIFQDPMTSLNPYLRIQDQLIEPLLIHENISKAKAIQLGVQALDDVGVPDPERRIRQYPHEFSGGMRQRVMIAMALITEPELLIADEPTTALDVTVQAQVIELIKEMQRKHGTAVILITHDLGVVAGYCDRVNVMYAGEIVESGSTEQVFYQSKHAYTIGLKESIPGNQTKEQRLKTIEGKPPDMSRPYSGCAFAPRSPLKHSPEQAAEPGVLKEIEPGHWVEIHPATVENYQQYLT